MLGAKLDDDCNGLMKLEGDRTKRGRPLNDSGHKSDFMRPQTISFLASVLRKDKRTIERKLAGVAPVAREGKSDLYDFADACRAVFRSETGLSAKALAKLDPTQLPPITQAAFWGAQKQRMAVYREAGDLWRSEDVEMGLDAVVRVFRDALVALPEKLTTASMTGKNPQDVAYAILESVEDQSARALRELKGQSFSAELALFEEQMTAQSQLESGELPEDD